MNSGKFISKEFEFKINHNSALKINQLKHSQILKFQCDECEYKTNIKACLKRHQMIHNKKYRFKCTECKYKTRYKANFKVHQLNHSGKFKFQCKLCEYETNDVATFRKHELTHSNKYKFSCTKCDYKTQRSYYLKVHMMNHSGTFRFNCTECAYKTNVNNHIKVHNLIHLNILKFNCQENHLASLCHCFKSEVKEFQINKDDDIKSQTLNQFHKSRFNKSTSKFKMNGKCKLQCDSCDYEADSEYFLVMHEMEHTEEIRFECSECPYTTTTKRSLFGHQSAKHLNSSGKSLLYCAKVKSETNNRKYKQKHPVNKIYNCSDCEFKSYCSKTYKHHRSKHSGIFSFNCSICPYTTNERHQFTMHQLNHSGSFKFNCLQCPSSTVSVQYSENQPRNHFCYHRYKEKGLKLQEKCNRTIKLQCDSCNYLTNNEYFLIFHEMQHTGEIMFECSECPYTAMSKKKLFQHQNMHKNSEPVETNS